MSVDDKLLSGAVDLALAAGRAAMEIYQTDFDVAHKDDCSPVTKADEVGEAIILAGLADLAPDIPVIAEEAASDGNIPEVGAQFFLVDPLDGTKEFVKKTGEFTINIALIEDGRPVMGVVYAPAIARLFYGALGAGAHVQTIEPDQERSAAAAPQPIETRDAPSGGLAVVVSASHRSPETDDYLKQFTVKDYKAAGSSLKFCLVAAGEADLYPRLGRTMEWDTAAGHAVVIAAGGRVIDIEANEPLAYGKVARGFDNPHFAVFGK